jgi:hypothetical protein
MATFAELVADVKTLTNRPDLSAEITLAVKAATLKAHASDFYVKDIFETAIIWDPAAYVQSLTYKSLVPRWRSFKYLRKYIPGATPDLSVDGDFFTLIDPTAATDGYKVNRSNVCYIAGEDLDIRSNTLDKYMLLGCYVWPDITEATYTSWVASEMPYAIVYEAASKIFKQIGWDEQSATFDREVTQQYTLLKINYIQGQGY